ncbi:hypothetical protein SPI_02776 [Niveomyces insectorum RCEF 264]|uniref:Uncharacterized protein n=1 Tax=Niveomyces insectorum RCEF 264 TaxID=1081102 RepID=A0A167Y8V0_9HYPO|nr:hypothetical protein SPI_02776 [Niveomyces insectorum RCEF 264]
MLALYSRFALAAMILSLVGLVQATPVPCPDSKIDLILNGKLSPEVCCSYGICKGDVVIKNK